MTRPASIVVFGVFNLVFGVLGACGGAVTIRLAMHIVENFGPGDEPLKNPPPLMLGGLIHDGRMDAIALIGAIFHALLCVMIGLAGLGLLRMRPWGLRDALRASVLLIGYFVVFDVVYQIYISDRAMAFMETALGPKIEPSGGRIFTVAAIATAIPLHLVYPALQLIYLRRPHVKQAFVPAP